MSPTSTVHHCSWLPRNACWDTCLKSAPKVSSIQQVIWCVLVYTQIEKGLTEPPFPRRHSSGQNKPRRIHICVVLPIILCFPVKVGTRTNRIVCSGVRRTNRVQTEGKSEIPSEVWMFLTLLVSKLRNILEWSSSFGVYILCTSTCT